MIEKNSLAKHKEYNQDVAAIVTAMTNDEQPFLTETITAVFSDKEIGQVILCVEENNNWLEKEIGTFMEDPRLTVVRMPFTYIGEVRNKALAYVQKPWVSYCDGDDVWCAGKTFIQRSYAEQTGADFIGAGHYLMTESGKIRAYGLSLFIPMPSSWLVRTEMMRRYPFNENSLKGSDGYWWVSTSKIIKKVKCPEMLVRYRVRSFSVSSMAYSKKRKLLFVNLACTPVLGVTILFLTYCLWIVTKHQSYRWISNWPKWLSDFERSPKPITFRA